MGQHIGNIPISVRLLAIHRREQILCQSGHSLLLLQTLSDQAPLKGPELGQVELMPYWPWKKWESGRGYRTKMQLPPR